MQNRKKAKELKDEAQVNERKEISKNNSEQTDYSIDTHWNGGKEISKNISDITVADVIGQALVNIMWCGDKDIENAYLNNEVDMQSTIMSSLIDQMGEVLSYHINEKNINVFDAAIIAALAAKYLDSHADYIPRDQDIAKKDE